MRNLILKRLLLLLPIIWGVATIVFVITHIIPGDPIDLILGETARGKMVTDKLSEVDDYWKNRNIVVDKCMSSKGFKLK